MGQSGVPVLLPQASRGEQWGSTILSVARLEQWPTWRLSHFWLYTDEQGQVMVDEVLPYENLSEELSRIRRRLAIVPGPLPRAKGAIRPDRSAPGTWEPSCHSPTLSTSKKCAPPRSSCSDTSDLCRRELALRVDVTKWFFTLRGLDVTAGLTGAPVWAKTEDRRRR